MRIIFKKIFRFNIKMILKNHFTIIVKKLRNVLQKHRNILKKYRNIVFLLNEKFLKLSHSRFSFPVIIFQPGKVGSLSVFHSLVRAYTNLYINTPIYHVHILNNFDTWERNIKQTRRNADENLAHIQEWRQLRERIDGKPEQTWNIINLVRDPIAIKISSLFQALHNFIPDWEERYQNGQLTMADLDELLSNRIKLRFDGLDSWYDGQIKAIWGLDVFSMDFPKDKGYAIYSDRNINLLIIRLEDLNRVAKEAFDQFLGLQNFLLSSRNVGDKKAYAQLYKEFKARPLSKKIVEDAYSSRYARHFYSEHELEQFKRNWLKY